MKRGTVWGKERGIFRAGTIMLSSEGRGNPQRVCFPNTVGSENNMASLKRCCDRGERSS